MYFLCFLSDFQAQLSQILNSSILKVLDVLYK
jgi:hypothetical protein